MPVLTRMQSSAPMTQNKKNAPQIRAMADKIQSHEFHDHHYLEESAAHRISKFALKHAKQDIINMGSMNAGHFAKSELLHMTNAVHRQQTLSIISNKGPWNILAHELMHECWATAAVADIHDSQIWEEQSLHKRHLRRRAKRTLGVPWTDNIESSDTDSDTADDTWDVWELYFERSRTRSVTVFYWGAMDYRWRHQMIKHTKKKRRRQSQKWDKHVYLASFPSLEETIRKEKTLDVLIRKVAKHFASEKQESSMPAMSQAMFETMSDEAWDDTRPWSPGEAPSSTESSDETEPCEAHEQDEGLEDILLPPHASQTTILRWAGWDEEDTL